MKLINKQLFSSFFLGVISIELVDDNQLVLVGEGTDVVQLTTRLRKKLGHADVISVTPVDENLAEEEE